MKDNVTEFIEGGLTHYQWFDTFKHCHDNFGFGMFRIDWPEEGAYVEQDNIVVQMFSIIRDELNIMSNSKTGTQNG